MFTSSDNAVLNVAEAVLDEAAKQGATGASVEIGESKERNVTVRLGQMTELEYTADNALVVTVYCGYKKGMAAAADLAPDTIKTSIAAALSIARHTEEDPCHGLADKALMAKDIKDLDLYHPWDLSLDAAQELAHTCEEAALTTDSKIDNSDGATLNQLISRSVYANSHGFAAVTRRSRYGLSCLVVARGADGRMQRDYWSDTVRDWRDLATPQSIGKTAASRALSRLETATIQTGRYPVWFDRTVSVSLIGHLISALSGRLQYRKMTFLLDAIGKEIAPKFFQLREEPHMACGLASTYYDDEGVATRSRAVVSDGQVEDYFLAAYSARKLQRQSTGNAGGAHHLVLTPNVCATTNLAQVVGTGLLVTELMGQGVNLLTGDYSRGAAGFWIENGVIQHAVDEITIAGNLRDMYHNILAIGADALEHRAHSIGAIIIDNMTVAAS